tara:strand:+ start:2174 stop:2350 length:177 start_codon:yes stop_codon:yes gene_type:complete
MKYFILHNYDADKWVLVTRKPLDDEVKTYALCDSLRDTNPNEKYRVVELMSKENLEVV